MARTAASSSTVIVSKSRRWSTSRGENVNAASKCTSSVSSRGRRFSDGSSSACATRAGSSGCGWPGPMALGNSAASIFCCNRGLRQNTSNAASKMARCS